ncbi:MAG: tandem-95 repeat protein, partial [Desulfobacterales bacterium]|nr:tandem-95 repeat protein [Desulfobacterales bacterium]
KEWHRYEFKISDTKFNDYPKFGVWPDGYYMSVNQFKEGRWAGGGAVAFERDKMLEGLDAGMVYFDLGELYPDKQSGYMLPSDLDGPLPPEGSPNYFVRFDDDAWNFSQDQLEIWEFHADWSYPDNALFVNPVLLPTAPFNSNLCGYDANCIPQPGTLAGLDAISSRLMYRLQYRNFGDYQAMTVNHTVNTDTDEGSHAGIRWYELRTDSNKWHIYQQGTYAPDEDHRWMGSIAMDRNGNMALGYSVSGHSTYPSIRYTGRLANDPLNQMTQGETTMIQGEGSQSGNHNRWGDYSMMSVDPADDCTFWYTQEYYSRMSDYEWQTRIGSLRFPSCTTGQSGGLRGQVTDNNGQPVENAKIRAGDSLTITHEDGFFSFSHLPAGKYDIIASAYGLISHTTPVTVEHGKVSALFFTLTPSLSHTVKGSVTDAKTGWPMYARITVSAELFSETVFTDPVTGYYSYDFFPDTLYELKVNAVVPGYEEEILKSEIENQASELNFALTADETCAAPGYGVLSETFDSCTLPQGWQILKSQISGSQFSIVSSQSSEVLNLTGGQRCYAVSDSSYAGFADVDTELISPLIDCSDLKRVNLVFKYDFYSHSGTDVADADVSNDGGITWTNVWSRPNGSERGPLTAGIDISRHARSKPDVRIRFHHYNAVNEYWWQIDDVKIYEPGVPCSSPDSGGLVVGNVYNANTGKPVDNAAVVSDDTHAAVAVPTPDDPGVADGFYVLYVTDGTHNLTAGGEFHGPDTKTVEVQSLSTVKQDFSMRSAGFEPEPDVLEARVDYGTRFNTVLTLNNKGGIYADYEIIIKHAEENNDQEDEPDWLRTNFQIGSVKPDGFRDINIAFNAAAPSVTEIGEYKALLTINYHDSQEVLTVPATMYVINAPAAKDDMAVTPPDESVCIEVLANDKVSEQDSITVQVTSDPLYGKALTDGAAITYTPNPGYTGKDSFTYKITNEHGDESEAGVFIGVWYKLTNIGNENLEIPDGNAGGVVSELNINNQGIIDSISVFLNIEHPYAEDLRLYLISPLGTRIALFENIPGNFAGIKLCDEAPFSITDENASYTKAFRPAEPLGEFKREPAGGIWKLEIYDDSNLDKGVLISWQLDIFYMFDSVITVDTTEDALIDDGNCSLREAVLAADTDLPVDQCTAGQIRDTVILPDGVYTLKLEGEEEDENKTGDIDIKGPGYLTVIGASKTGTILSTDVNDRLLHVHEGADLEIRNLTIRGGVPEPLAVSVEGGGIINEGNLLIKNSILTENNSSYRGGGLYNLTGEAVLISTDVTANKARYGAGVNNRFGKLTITNSVVSGNNAISKGGGVYNYSGETGINFAVIENNSTDDGAGLYNNTGQIHLNSASIDNNNATGKGGGIYNASGIIRLDSATVNGNNAFDGGGIYSLGGEQVLLNSTVTGNSADYSAGIYNRGKADIDFSTITGNKATDQGGGISSFGTTWLRRTLVAGNYAFSDRTTSDVRGTVTSFGSNLIGNSAGGKGFHSTDLLDAEPLLVPLADNGGSVMTHAVQATSPAANAAECYSSDSWEGFLVEKDQRGKNRPWGVRCDIGAFEYDGGNYPPIASDDSVSTWGKPVTVNVLVNDADTDGDALTITAVTVPNSGAAEFDSSTVTYTPNQGFTGEDSFSYTITDGEYSDEAEVTVIVHLNTPPSVRDDAVVTFEQEPVSIDVLSNDSDRDGDTLSVSGMTAPGGGVISFNSNIITYTPNRGFIGQDTFDYSVSDGIANVSASVFITVLAENVSINVTTSEDELNEDGDCSLREAVHAASTDQPADKCPGGGYRDTIVIPEGIFSLSIPKSQKVPDTDEEDWITDNAEGDLDITDAIVIIRGSTSKPSILDGNNLDRLLHIYEGADVELHNITIQGGLAEELNGGGILNQGKLNITACTFVSNSADKGGAIYNKGMLNLSNSTVSGNSAATKGGGIYNEAEAGMNFCTIANNEAVKEGGGIYIAEKCLTQLKNTLISGNSAETGGPDVLGTVKSLGTNLVGISSGSIGYNSSDILNQDPLIVPLSDNGGPSMTHAVQANSPGADAAVCQVSETSEDATGETDQRGVARPWGESCDIGAFEYDDKYYPPMAADDSAYTMEDRIVAIRVLENDRDANGIFFISGISQAENGEVRNNLDGTITYTPHKSFVGTDSFHYTISDLTGTDSAEVTVTVEENSPPVPQDDTVSTRQDRPVIIEVLKNDTDPDSFELTVTEVADPDNGTAVTDGATVIYTPDEGFFGSESFMYRITDGSKADKGLISVTVYRIDLGDAIWILKLLADIENDSDYKGPHVGMDGRTGFEEVIFILQNISEVR